MRNYISQMCVFPTPSGVGEKGRENPDSDGVPMKTFYIYVIVLPQVGPDQKQEKVQFHHWCLLGLIPGKLATPIHPHSKCFSS